MSHQPAMLPIAGAIGSAPGVDPGAFLFDFLFGLVAGTGTCRGTDGATDDSTRRARHGTADEGTGSTATQRAGPRTSLVVAFGCLTGNGTTDGACGTTDHRPDRAADGHPDRRPAERTGAGADGFHAALFVLDRGPVGGVVMVVVDRLVMRMRVLACVVRHCSLLGFPDPVDGPGDGHWLPAAERAYGRHTERDVNVKSAV